MKLVKLIELVYMGVMYQVDRKTFYNLPSGTIFTNREGNITVKHNTLYIDDNPRDWVERSLSSVKEIPDCAIRLLCGESIPIDKEFTYCNGTFDEDETFLIFEKPDLEWLRSKIDEAIKISK